VEDIVEQLASALDYPAEGELQVVNVGTGRATSLLELIATLEKLAGPLEVRHELERPGDIRHSLADVSRLREAARRVGASVPATPLETGLAAMVSPPEATSG